MSTALTYANAATHDPDFLSCPMRTLVDSGDRHHSFTCFLRSLDSVAFVCVLMCWVASIMGRYPVVSRHPFQHDSGAFIQDSSGSCNIPTSRSGTFEYSCCISAAQQGLLQQAVIRNAQGTLCSAKKCHTRLLLPKQQFTQT